VLPESKESEPLALGAAWGIDHAVELVKQERNYQRATEDPSEPLEEEDRKSHSATKLRPMEQNVGKGLHGLRRDGSGAASQMGTCSTIFSPKPSRATTLRG
jgi:hypothetical protein